MVKDTGSWGYIIHCIPESIRNLYPFLRKIMHLSKGDLGHLTTNKIIKAINLLKIIIDQFNLSHLSILFVVTILRGRFSNLWCLAGDKCPSRRRRVITSWILCLKMMRTWRWTSYFAMTAATHQDCSVVSKRNGDEKAPSADNHLLSRHPISLAIRTTFP